MADIEHLGSGPLFFFTEGEQFTQACHSSEQAELGCDIELAMKSPKYTSVDGAPPADINICTLICHGLRSRTSQERSAAAAMGEPADMICNLEVAHRLSSK